MPTLGVTDTLIRGLGHHTLSYSSSCISEFFDAHEYTEDGARSEYSSDEDLCSDNDENDSSDDEQQYHEAQ